jgi:serine O-acetyltransferase
MRVTRLIASDYRAHAGARGDSGRAMWLRAFPRFLLNPSLHATVLIRLSNASPVWLHWFWRNLLIWKHAIDLGWRTEIGPGLRLPHPLGIVIAPQVVLGENVTLFHNVSVGANMGRAGVAHVGDRAILFSGCHVLGPIKVGNDCIVGANAYLDRDLPAGSAWGGRGGVRKLAAGSIEEASGKKFQ